MELVKGKRGHFLYRLFCPKEIFWTFVFYSMYSALNTLSEYIYFYISKKQPPEMLYKKMFWKISQNSQENICARVCFLITLQARGWEARGWKKKLWHRCEFCRIFKNTFFTEHLRTAASNPRKPVSLILVTRINKFWK